MNGRKHQAATSTHITAYGFYYHLDLYSNFTFFLDDPVNGGQIHRKDQHWVAVAKVDHTNAGYSFHSNDARGTTTTADPVTSDPVKGVDLLVWSKGANDAGSMVP